MSYSNFSTWSGGCAVHAHESLLTFADRAGHWRGRGARDRPTRISRCMRHRPSFRRCSTRSPCASASTGRSSSLSGHRQPEVCGHRSSLECAAQQVRAHLHGLSRIWRRSAQQNPRAHPTHVSDSPVRRRHHPAMSATPKRRSVKIASAQHLNSPVPLESQPPHRRWNPSVGELCPRMRLANSRRTQTGLPASPHEPRIA